MGLENIGITSHQLWKPNFWGFCAVCRQKFLGHEFE